MTTPSLADLRRRPLVLPRVTVTRRLVVTATALAALAGIYGLLLHDLFTNLGTSALLDFDESRHIASAMEMLRSGNWIVNTYRDSPDFWNLKPPLSFWTIALSVQAFGPSVLAVRLPSALATIAGCLLCTGVAWRWRGPVAAVVAAASFGSARLLVDFHSGRTADPDAVFILLMTVGVLAAVWASRRPWLVVVATTAFSLAFLTKSFHALLLLPFVAVVLLLNRRTSAVRPRHLLVATAGLLPVVLWAIARYQYDGTAFFKAMVNTDVLARTGSVVEGHTGGPDFYVNNLQVTFGPWLLPLVIAAAAVCGPMTSAAVRQAVRDSESVRRALALAGWTVLVIVAFSMSASKLPWYSISVLPPLCVLIGAVVATALPRVGRPMVAAIALTGLLAMWLGQIAIMEARRVEQPIGYQAVFEGLQTVPGLAGQHIYVDPVLSGWQQNLVAAAEINAPVYLQDGNDAGYSTDTQPGPLILLQDGSPAAQSVMQKDPKVLASKDGWLIVQRTAGATP